MNRGTRGIRLAHRIKSGWNIIVYPVLIAILLPLLLLSCANPGPSNTSQIVNREVDVNPNAVVPPDDGQWTMAAKDYANTRFSGLDQINTSNVVNLKTAWTFSTGIDRGHEAAPLIVGDTMYIVTPYPNILFALDLKNNGSPKWKYEPQPESASQGVACCDVVNRGAAFSNGKIFFNTLDD